MRIQYKKTFVIMVLFTILVFINQNQIITTGNSTVNQSSIRTTVKNANHEEIQSFKVLNPHHLSQKVKKSTIRLTVSTENQREFQSLKVLNPHHLSQKVNKSSMKMSVNTKNQGEIQSLKVLNPHHLSKKVNKSSIRITVNTKNQGKIQSFKVLNPRHLSQKVNKSSIRMTVNTKSQREIQSLKVLNPHIISQKLLKSSIRMTADTSNQGEIQSFKVLNPHHLSKEINQSSIRMTVNTTNQGEVQSLKVLTNNHLSQKVKKLLIRTIVNTTNRILFNSYNLNNPPLFNLHDEVNIYFIDIDKGGTMCFIEGTDLQNSHRKCKCKEKYFGDDCGIPAAAWFSFFKNKERFGKLRRRVTPRRVIHGMHVFQEFDMFEACLSELYNTVDVFVIAEANHTDYGDPKPLLFFNKLKDGYMREYQNKIMHVFMDSEPPNAKEDNWKAHNFMRSLLGPQSLSRIIDIRDDDLFIVTDADEIPTHEIINFLKLYDGYYEHVCFRYRWSIYGFFWKQQSKIMTEVCSVSSIKMLREKYSNNTRMIRAKENGRSWWAGVTNHYAGWHCSWCLSPEGIVQKLNAAQGADRPRWGDFPEKKNITYIKRLIHVGRWFDGKGRFVPAQVDELMYAPGYLLKNYDKYKKILYHPNRLPHWWQGTF